MNIANAIEVQFRELLSCSKINGEYLELYSFVKHDTLRDILATLHHDFISLYSTMNDRLPTNHNVAHFWAEPSRELIKRIDIALSLYGGLKNTNLAFEIDAYYFSLMNRCREFLRKSGGSEIPPNMDKVNLYYKIPIFTPANNLTVKRENNEMSFDLRLIGEGSYAHVYKYRDPYYNRHFVVKRAKKDLSPKEIERFKREYEVMNQLSSPYIVEVFCFDEDKIQYTMEYMDFTLDDYIQKHNSILTASQRKRIANQILRGFEYIHSKGHLHRDISPKNVLVKEYEDTVVIKISDFGLVKIPDSTLTSVNTEFKGCFNDPALVVEGFDSYSMEHEIYALTRLVYYVVTGRTNTYAERINDSKLRGFVETGLCADRRKRFSNVSQMINAFNSI